MGRISTIAIFVVGTSLYAPFALSSDARARYDCGAFGRPVSDEASFRVLCLEALPGGANWDSNGCATEFDRNDSMVFQPGKHRAWYDRFWTGRCRNFSFLDFCRPDAGGWTLLIDQTLAQVPEANRSALRAEVWALGRMIGFEWAKNNDLRAIHTRQHLEPWFDVITRERPWAAVARICAEAVEAILQHEAR